MWSRITGVPGGSLLIALKPRFACTAVALSLGTSACLVAPVQAQEGQPIGTIELRGVVNINPDVVRRALAEAGIKEGQIYRRELVEAARRRVVDTGYYSDLLLRAELGGDKRVTLTIEVFENPLIQNVIIKGNRVVSSEEITPQLNSRPNTVINVNTIRQDAQRIQRIYRSKGYEAFLSEVEEVFDPKTGILTFPVTEVVVGSIEVEGLKKTREFVVTREMRTKVGEPLNSNVLRRDFSRILGTGLFANVQQPIIEPIEEGRQRLVIPVVEQRTGQVQVGFGYSVQQRLTGTLQIAEQNFQGRGQGVSASWTVGGTIARNQFELGFTEPWLDRNNTSIGVNVYSRFIIRFNRVLSANATDGSNDNQYFEERRGGSVTLSRPTSDVSRVSTTFRTESIRANNLQPDYNLLTDAQINNIRGALVQNGDVTAVTLRSTVNTRDNDLDPARGFFFAPAIEIGSSNFTSQKPRINPAYISSTATPTIPRVLVDDRQQNGGFSKYNVDVRRYFSLNGERSLANLLQPKRVIATRLLLGSSAGNIAFGEQYFIGGADDLRGYANQRFWGNNLFLANVELRLPTDRRGDLNIVTFLDYGAAWGATEINREDIPGFGQSRGFAPRLGAGLGVRLRTPVGPVRLDYAFGENPQTHFAIGPTF